MKTAMIWLAMAAGLWGQARPAGVPTGVLEARWHEAGFAGDDNYNAVTAASDGQIYFVLAAHKIDLGAHMFRYDPATGKVEKVADLTEACGEKGQKTIPQGKSHVDFQEYQGKLYFATHLGYYQTVDGKEMVGLPPAGYKAYPGGHFLAYDLKTGKMEDLGTAPSREGIITMAMDRKNERLLGLTWPSGRFIAYDLKTRKVRDYGLTAGEGEKGEGGKFRVVCRSIGVDQVTGAAYFSDSEGRVWRHGDWRQKTELEVMAGVSLKRPALGEWDPEKPGHMGYNWRQVVWHAGEKAFYGVHGNTGTLVRFDSRAGLVELGARLVSEKTLASGLRDSFPYGYLGLTLGPDGETLYYLTGTPAGEEVRFVTYHIPTKRYTDHGALALADGRRPNWAQSIAVGRDGRVYTVSKIMEGGRQKVDLLSFADPLRGRASAEPVYDRVRSWLDPAGMAHPLKEAHSLCFDRAGNVIVVDSVGSRVHRFTAEGKWLGEIGRGPGDGAGEFRSPRDARVHPSGEIYVSDAGHGRIEVFGADGKFVRAFGSQGSGPGQMLRAHGLEFSRDGSRLYVVDVDNNRVSVFEASGRFLFSFGKKGAGTGEFRDAHGIGVAPNGDVIVSNYYGPAQRFTSEGKFLYEFAAAGLRGWIHFHGMTTDAAGYSYLAARDRDGRNAIAIYDARGGYVTALTAVTAEGEQGVKTAAVSADGDVYVAVESKTRHGVQVFRRRK